MHANKSLTFESVTPIKSFLTKINSGLSTLYSKLELDSNHTYDIMYEYPNCVFYIVCECLINLP